MQTKYLNDAIIGNKKMVASYNKKGELLRLYYPAPDHKQYIDYCYAGLKINDSCLIKLHDDINNEYNQYYTEDTNILIFPCLNFSIAYCLSVLERED